MALTCWSKTT